VQKQHCRADGWSTPDQFWHACYSDIPALYGSAGLGAADRPGLGEAVAEGRLQQAPLAAAAMWVVSGVVDPSPTATAPRRFFDLSAIVLAAALAVGVACVAVAAGRRRWDAAHVALSPLLVTAGLVSYELLAVALVSGALLAAARRRPVAAGVLLGLATATRPLAAVVGVAVVAVAVRAGRRRQAALAAGLALVVWLAVRVLLIPGLGAGLARAWDTWRQGGPGYGSLWFVPSLVAQNRPRSARIWYEGAGLSAGATTALSLLGTALVIAGVVALAFTARRRPRAAHLALIGVAGCLVVAKAVPVQVSLLLLPLLALSALPWRDHLVWATTEVAYFVGVWLYIAGSSVPNRGLPGGLYLLLLLARLGGIAWLGVQALRAVLDPGPDPAGLPDDGSRGHDGRRGGRRGGGDAPLVPVS
jgi:hypothetical protein